MQKTALKNAIIFCGSKARLAKAIGATRAAIGYWMTKDCGEGEDLLSPLFATAIEMATEHHVKREELCPKTYKKIARNRGEHGSRKPDPAYNHNLNMEFMD